MDRRLEQRAGVAVAQTRDRSFGETLQGRVLARLARREHQGHRFGQEAARHERERLGRCLVEPLGVVDEADQRLLLRGVRQQAQHRQANQQAVGRLAGRESERRGECVALGAWQVRQPFQQRYAQLMQAGERDLHLGLRAGNPHDPTPGAHRRQVVQQRRLADARLTAQHEHTAAAAPHVVQQTTQGPRARCADQAS